jgi:hypothetical protein
MSRDSIEGLPRFIGYDVLVLDAGDDFDGSTTAITNVNVDIEDALESLGPGHCDVPFSG